MNYFVPIPGHIAWFAHYHEALSYAFDFDSWVYNLSGFMLAKLDWSGPRTR